MNLKTFDFSWENIDGIVNIILVIALQNMNVISRLLKKIQHTIMENLKSG